jgi:hypothetical protein
LLAAAAMQLPAQYSQSRRASIVGNGNGDQGKCTIEVDVDQSAEVEIRGDSGRIRTLSGQPATWRRFECTGPIPRNPTDFRFRGIDGRGRQQLVGDPRQSGVAVVRIDDPKGGREGYTFDLEWRGGTTSGYGQPGYGQPGYNQPGYNQPGYGQAGGRYGSEPYNANPNDHRYDDRRGGHTVTCESRNGHRQYCGVDTSGGVRIVREMSNGACRSSSNWGYDKRGIWVDRGCAAEFAIGNR